MPRGRRFTVKEIAALTKPGFHCDGEGLYVRVAANKGRTKSWVFRYASPTTGVNRYMGLGSYRDVTVATAREQAEKQRRKLRKGKDPIDAREAKQQRRRAKAVKTLTFGECAARVIAKKQPEWRNAAHAAQWHSTFNDTRRGRLRFPAHTALLNDVPVDEVTTDLVLECLNKVWLSKPETAKRVRARIEEVLSWAKTSGLRTGDNPARWKDHLDQLLAAPSKVRAVKHHASLPYPQIPQFMQDLASRNGVTARALEFLVLTAARTGAVIHARRSEIDFERKLWTVPAERTGSKIKDGEPREVPLCDRAIALLRNLPNEDGNPYLFIGGKRGRGLSAMAMLELMREIAPPYVPHGFRSTFKVWSRERTNFPDDVGEAALWHTISDAVKKAYTRTRFLELRYQLMDQWAAFCSQPPPATQGDNVRTLRSSAGGKP